MTTITHVATEREDTLRHLRNIMLFEQIDRLKEFSVAQTIGTRRIFYAKH